MVRDTFIVDDSTNCFCKKIGYADLLYLGTALRVGDRVGKDNLLEGGVLYTFAGRATHHTMGSTGTNGLCTSSLHDVCSLSDSTGCINHIVYDDHVLAFHVTNNLHGGNHVGTGTGLIAQHQGTTQILGIGIGAFWTTNIGWCDNKVIKLEAFQVRQDDVGGIQMVNRNIN